MNRRDFIKTCALGAAGVNLSSCAWGQEAAYLSAYTDHKNQFQITGLNRSGTPVFSLPVSSRGHSMAVNPAYPHCAVYISRRPGVELQQVNVRTGQMIARVKAAKGRHFVGHGFFTANGDYLLTPENDYEKGRGIVSVRNADNLKVLSEMPSFGIGPHEVHMLHDGKTLVVANGGIQTHPSKPREKLNLPSMQPSLVYIDLATGKLIGEYRLPDHQQSIRHIDVAYNDTVAIAAQYEGDYANKRPLVFTHQGEDALTPMREYAWRQLKQYTGSVTFADHRSVLLVSSPRSHTLTLWDANSNELIKDYRIQDVCGVAWDAVYARFLISNGLGDLFTLPIDSKKLTLLSQNRTMRWDNHLVAL